MVFPYNDDFVVGLTGDSVAPFMQTQTDYVYSAAQPYFRNGKLYAVNAIYLYGYTTPVILTLKAADKDWVFSVHSAGCSNA
jgi:hypothetical protein